MRRGLSIRRAVLCFTAVLVAASGALAQQKTEPTASARLSKTLATLGETIDRDGKQVPTDTVLTDPEDFEIKERLDYIFWLNRAEASKVQVDIDKTFIEPQFAAPNSPFPQLSDHFGVSTELFLL